jgi:RNA polymerase sigma factor (sigma-70 family)
VVTNGWLPDISDSDVSKPSTHPPTCLQGRLEKIYAAHAHAARAYARRRVPADVVDDVVSDVFVIAWRKMEHVPEEPLPWLLSVARRVVSNHRRSTNRRRALVTRLRVEEPTPGTSAEESGVIRALASLRERDREALMLIAWEGLSQSEAASVLSCSPAVFRVRLHRARERLRRALSAYQRSGNESESSIRLNLIARRGEAP